jgi:hypothetical protein
MNSSYKGYSIVAGAEFDDSSSLWNGRYRILDDKGIVVYESFSAPLQDQEKAAISANEAARGWIDKQ